MASQNDNLITIIEYTFTINLAAYQASNACRHTWQIHRLHAKEMSGALTTGSVIFPYPHSVTIYKHKQALEKHKRKGSASEGTHVVNARLPRQKWRLISFAGTEEIRINVYFSHHSYTAI